MEDKICNSCQLFQENGEGTAREGASEGWYVDGKNNAGEREGGVEGDRW